VGAGDVWFAACTASLHCFARALFVAFSTTHLDCPVPTLSGTLSYIKNFIQDRDVAAVAPSSSFLVERVCKWIDFDEPAVIVEYGPGNGVFSTYILDHMTDDSTLILVESNPDFVDMLEDMTDGDPRAVVVEDLAQNVEEILAEQGIDEVDYIVSGIPFSFLDADVKEELLGRTREVLADDGKFLVYQNYNHLEEPLRKHFSEVTKEREFRNIPPTMRAYEACK
jgi:phospholipid N-methyltransferase